VGRGAATARDDLTEDLPGAEHLIAYHVITEGRCFANIIGDDPIAIEAGEVIVFTRGDPHVLSSSPGMRTDLGPSDKLAKNPRRQPVAILDQLWRRRTDLSQARLRFPRLRCFGRSIRFSITCHR